MIRYNSNFNPDFDNNIEFIDIDLPSKKLSIQLPANDVIVYIIKKCILEIKDKANKFSKVKII